MKDVDEKMKIILIKISTIVNIINQEILKIFEREKLHNNIQKYKFCQTYQFWQKYQFGANIQKKQMQKHWRKLKK